MKLTESKVRQLVREEVKKVMSEANIRYSEYSTSIKIPFTVNARDYHQFESLQRVVNTLVPGSTVKFEELGMDGGTYLAVFYSDGQRPSDMSDKAISEMYNAKMQQLIKEL